jgi:hypothetical protein
VTLVFQNSINQGYIGYYSTVFPSFSLKLWSLGPRVVLGDFHEKQLY